MWWKIVPVLLIACSGPDPAGNTDDIVPLPDDTDVPPEDTGTTEEEEEEDGGYLDAAFFTMLGQFAFDDEAGAFVTWADKELGPQPIRLSVTLIDGKILETGILDAENSCTISLEWDQPIEVAAWAEDEGAWAAFDVPTAAAVDDGCATYRFPGEWNGDPVAAITQWRFGLGLTTLSDETEELLRYQLPASEWAAAEPYVVGGVFQSNLFAAGGLPETLSDQVGFGYAVDGNFEVEESGTGNPIPIRSEDVETTEGIATGFYEVETGLFSPGNLLTAVPGP